MPWGGIVRGGALWGFAEAQKYLLRKCPISSRHVALANSPQWRKGQVKQKTRSTYIMTVCMIGGEQT